MKWTEKLTGYMRRNGRKGTRNLVAVLAAADNVNPLARQLAARIPGVVCLPASYGRGQMGRDYEVSLRAMSGLATHPNVAECLVVSFEPESGERVAERANKLGRKVQTLSFLDCGGLNECLERGAPLLRELCKRAAGTQRVAIAAGDLVIGLECGGSDTTSGLFGNPALGAFTDAFIDLGGTAVFSEPVECLGGEALLRKRAASSEIAARLVATVHAYDALAREHGVDLAGTNPTPDNLAGGLTSIEEKSLGALAKTGSRPIMGVIDYAEYPPASGVWMMDAPAAAVENVTALAAAGAQLVCFVTGTGNPTGHPVSPTIKITANPNTMQRMREHIDVDLTAMLHGRMNVAQGAQEIATAAGEVINASLTAAERLQYLETNISRIGPSV
jgi:altronate dehydratase large subunit